MRRWWNVELVECHLSLCDDCINHCMKGELVLNCFHSIWWCGWKWCVDGWNVTQTERRALKERINILDCVQREWRGARLSSVYVCRRVRKCVHIVWMYVCGEVEMCLWEGWVCACVQMLMDWSLLHWSHWFSHAGIQSQDVTHTPTNTQTHVEKV